MSFGLSNRGEELHYRNGFVGQDLDVTIYLDSTDVDGDGSDEGDNLTDSDDITVVTTEPSVSRPTVTVEDTDIEMFDDDFGFEKSVKIGVDGISGEIDGVLLIESGTDNIISRSKIQDPEPGPYQSLDGLKEIEVKPRLTTD